MSVGLSFASVFAGDIESLSHFYRRVFGFDEVTELRSEHFRGMRVGDTILGFSAHTAYGMLNLEAPEHLGPGVRSLLTFEADSDAQVDSLTAIAVAAGGTCLTPPARTYYGAWQSVLLDPEGNAFRINHLLLQAH